MADYYSFTKTSFFRCSDVDALKALISECFCGEDSIKLFDRETENGETLYAFGAYDSIEGVEDENGDYDYDLFLNRLQKLLPDGEAVILTEVGHMKLIEVYGRVDIITKTEIKSESLGDIGARTACSLLNNPNWKPID